MESNFYQGCIEFGETRFCSKLGGQTCTLSSLKFSDDKLCSRFDECCKVWKCDMPTSPLISVIVSAHKKRKHYLKEAVDSVLAQSLNRSSFEIIVVLDYEDSAMIDALNRDGVKTVVVLNDSLTLKLIEASKVCNGEIICFLEDDDKFERNKLEWVHFLFNSDTSLAFYHNSYYTIDASGVVIQTKLRRAPDMTFRINKLISFSQIRKCLKSELGFNLSSISIRKKIFVENLSTIALLRAHIDTALFIISLCSEGAIYADDRRLTQYRVHPSASNFVVENREYFRMRYGYYDVGFNDFLALEKVFPTGKQLDIINIYKLDWNIHLCLFSEIAQRSAMLVTAMRYTAYALLLRYGYPLFLSLVAIIYVMSPTIARMLFYYTISSNSTV